MHSFIPIPLTNFS